MATPKRADFGGIVNNTQTTATVTTGKSGGGGGSVPIPKREDLYETERQAKWLDLFEYLDKVIDYDMTPRELDLEKEGIERRLHAARTDKFLAVLMGGSGNNAAPGLMAAAAEDENKLMYLHDIISANPKEYVRHKKEATLKELAQTLAGAGQFAAAGGLSKAEATSAIANLYHAQAAMSQAGAAWASVSAGTRASGGSGGGDSLEALRGLQILKEAGASKKMVKAYESWLATRFPGILG